MPESQPFRKGELLPLHQEWQSPFDSQQDISFPILCRFCARGPTEFCLLRLPHAKASHGNGAQGYLIREERGGFVRGLQGQRVQHGEVMLVGGDGQAGGWSEFFVLDE